MSLPKKLFQSLKKIIKAILEKLDDIATNVAANSIFLSNLYYAFQWRFGWEHRAVLSGKKIYAQSLKNPIFNTSLLRRNTHRLEKGLLMRPRRVPFGLNYIEETVDAYIRAVASKVVEARELAWARDVLQEYMAITPSHPVVDPLREPVAQASLSVPQDDNECSKIPYLRSTTTKPDISYDQLLTLAKYRRSVRWFEDKPVSREIIDKAIDVAAYSPTACNRQPYEFRIFDDKQLVSELAKLPMGTVGFGQQIPCIAVVVGKLRNYSHERDRHLIYIDGSLAIMSFINALEVQGIGSCCLNWPDVPKLESKMAKLLNLAADERPIMLIAFGHPDSEGLVANSTKKPLNQIRTYNNLGERQ